jgi:SAM-dependent methyltransferase
MFHNFYNILESPVIYRLVQMILAPGGERTLRKLIPELLGDRMLQDWLDVGCGPKSLLPPLQGKRFGVDISPRYLLANETFSNCSAAADASSLPFKTGSFAGALTIGLLHHLPDESAKKVLLEMIRVCGNDGKIIVIDAVLPRFAWRRPLAEIIRRADRGNFMRRQTEFVSILPKHIDWKVERTTYTWNGLEMLVAQTGRI